MRKLTKRVVEDLKPSKVGVEGSDLFEWDLELKGFGVRVSPQGLKSFIVQYRMPSGRNRRTVIGRFGLMTVEQARIEAHERLVAVSRGIDPAEETASARGTMTIAEICDWYLREAEEGRILGRRNRPIKASTLAMDRSRIETHVKPLIGAKQVRGLKLADVEGMQADVARGKTAKARAGNRGGAATGGEGVAARTISTLHAILEHAVRLGLIEANPARGVRRLASTPKERRLSTSEISRLGRAMAELADEGEHANGLTAIRLLLLTGFRRLEALGLERSWFDAEARCIRFPDTKSGAQVRVIGKAACDLIEALPGRKGSQYVFPADWGDGHFVGVVRVLDRVCVRAQLDGVTPHVLRHTFASVAGDLGFSELTIAALLGHAARGVTQRYVHIDEALRIGADRVAGEIAKLLDGGTTKRGHAASAQTIASGLEMAG